MIIVIISDTHGALNQRVEKLFSGVDMIVHAGDLGSMEVLKDLESIAPLLAVRGNCDRGALLERLPEKASLETPAGLLVVTHLPPRGHPPYERLSPSRAPSIVVFGHTHFPKILDDGGIILLNPGSALRGRGAPPTVARMGFDDQGRANIEFFSLETGLVFPVSMTKRHAHGSSA